MPTAAINRIPLYLFFNLGFALLAGIGCAAGGFPDPRLLYLILLFALCSTSAIDLDGLNGRYALLALFMLVYFVTFGVGDLSNLLMGGNFPDSSSFRPTSDLLDGAEALILVGGIMLVLGYRTAVFMMDARRSTRSPRDWSKRELLMVGLIFWVLGTIATYRWYVYIILDTTNEAFRKGLSGISSATATAYLLATMCQPLGMLLLVYLSTVFRKSYLMVLIVCIVTMQIFIGFVSDSKGLAMIGIIIVMMTGTLVSGRLPKAWLAIGVIFVTLIYPYFTAYRAAIHGAGIARTTVVENFGEILKKTMAAKDRVNSGRERAQTFLERSNVKGSVEAVVAKAGNGVAFQGGYTLSPILETFIPKVFWSDKQHIPTGQFFNKQFHLVEGDEVYISPSHLGELYWNFGWSGVVLGMGLIGLICGWVGAGFNLAEYRTVTRVLVTVLTIKQLIVAFESTIADCYVVWLRSLAGIGILHLIFARVPVVSRFFQPTGPAPKRLPADDRPSPERPFPNLLT
jgi:hypothetical protein